MGDFGGEILKQLSFETFRCQKFVKFGTSYVYCISALVYHFRRQKKSRKKKEERRKKGRNRDKSKIKIKFAPR